VFLQNVKCLRYGTLCYVTWGWKTSITRHIMAQFLWYYVARAWKIHETCTQSPQNTHRTSWHVWSTEMCLFRFLNTWAYTDLFSRR